MDPKGSICRLLKKKLIYEEMAPHTLVIISCSTCCLVGPAKATWVCASFNSNLVIISCSTCCLVGPVKATWVLQLMMTSPAADDDYV